MTSCSSHSSQGPGADCARSVRPDTIWRPFELLAMVLGFAPRQSRGGWSPFGGMRPTGNRAFDEWRDSELARLEEERRKLEEAEREFAVHIEELRRARDREEFERFMKSRHNRPMGEAS